MAILVLYYQLMYIGRLFTDKKVHDQNLPQNRRIAFMMFPHLFAPLKIGNLEIPNRIVMLSMTTGYGEADETVGDRFINFFAQRAKGGAGLIIIPLSPLAAGSPAEPGIFDDRFLPGIRKLTAALKACKAKTVCQLITSYHVIFRDNLPEVVAPSPVFNQILRVVPRAVTREEIGLIIEEYGKAARRAQDAGFDAVEILVGAGYFLNRFLSPVSNKRDDAYGGTLENRMRIILEVISCIKKTAGKDFPLGIRLNIEEQMPEGHTVEDSKIVAQALEKAGVQFINCYTGWHEAPLSTVACSLPPGAFAHLTGQIRSVVNIPVIATNRINDPFAAEKILEKGQADLTGMARALLADPELPNKAKEGRIDEIVPCIACSNCIGEIMNIYKNWGEAACTSCTVNPQVGKEGRSWLAPAAKRKKVFIIGGGPAGLVAARTAAERGHHVTLFEKDAELGGWLRVGCLPPYKDEIRVLAERLSARAHQSGVKVQLNSEANPYIVAEGKPDVLILAYGAAVLIPDLPGVHLPHVLPAEEVLAGRNAVQGSVIIIGGGLVGCETAEFLIQQVKGVTSVTILEMQDRLAVNISPTYRPFFLARLKKIGIRSETKITVQAITDHGVEIIKNGVPEFLKGDAVVLAIGLQADRTFAEKFQGVAPEIFSVGDCVKPRMIREAIEEGFQVGREI